MNTTDWGVEIDTLKSFFEFFPLGVAISEDADLEKVWLNPKLVKILHLDPAIRIIRKSPLAHSSLQKVLCNGKVLKDEDLPMHRVAKSGEHVEGVEMDIMYGDGRVVSVIEYAMPIVSDDKKIDGVVAAFVDVTSDRQNQVKDRGKARL